MREIPILFSTPMVQAILDGRKSMTRRICKDIAGYDFKWGLDKEPYIGNYKVFTKTEPGKWDWVTLENQWLYDLQTAVDDSRTHLLKCPYGQPGDRLYVRETWRRYSRRSECTCYEYCHCPPDGTILYYADCGPDENKWKPSIHMPKAAARIWLEVTNVRVERLQEITAHECILEGISSEDVLYNTPVSGDFAQYTINQFKNLWNSINAKRGYGWDSNPWVRVISFKKVTP